MARVCHSSVLRSSSSGTHLVPPTSLMVAARSQSSTHRPGVVGAGVVVVVVVVVVVEEVDVLEVSVTAAALAAARIFSTERGVVDTVGHPVNSVVALTSVTRKVLYKLT